MSSRPHLCRNRPEDFDAWSVEARRAWIAGQATQREMLNYLAHKLGVDFETEPSGTMTNRELAEFVAKATRHLY